MGRAWPEEPERAERRIRGIVESVIVPGELDSVTLQWIERTPVHGEPFEDLEVRVSVLQGSEGFGTSVWPYRDQTWEQALELFALALENWIYDSRFAGGEIRTPQIPS